MARPVIASLRGLLFAILFYPATILFVLLGMAASLFGTVPMRIVIRAWARFHGLLVRALIGIHPRVEGTLPQGPHLIALKHQSMFETIEVLRIFHHPVVVLKRELADLPLWGALARRYGIIPVEREAGAAALRLMLTLGRQAVADGRSVVIFPEGTRVPPGETPPLRPGFAGLYRVLGLPVVPIAIDSGRLWTRGLAKRPGTVTYRIGETIPPGLKRDEIEAKVHAAINALEISSPGNAEGAS
jgi:1-acyl-sn-glycerol-3-phosphate acyltransferase